MTQQPEQAICQGRHGCQNPAAELHVCPYQSEINDDNETLCNCCSECERDCSDDI
jgi:hypothetical protein